MVQDNRSSNKNFPESNETQFAFLDKDVIGVEK